MATKSSLKSVTERLPQREALALAQADYERTKADHSDAAIAASKVRERIWAAQERLAALQETHVGAAHNHATAYIAALQDGRDPSIAEIEGRAKSIGAEEAAIRAEIEVLTKTREELDRVAAEGKELILAAERKIGKAVAEVLRSEIDVATILREAEALEPALLSRRAALLQLQSLLPKGAEKDAVDLFLARRWMVQPSGEYRQHPAAQMLAAAMEALKRDADEPLPAM